MQPASASVAPWYFDWIRHSTRDDYWTRWSIRDRYASVRVPVLDFEGWYDAFLAGGMENFAGMVRDGGTQQARDNQRLVIGPWDHVDWGRRDSTPAPMLKDDRRGRDSPINDLMLAWFDHFLKGETGNGVAGKPRVDYFLMGANTWKSASAGRCRRPAGPPTTCRRRQQAAAPGAHHSARRRAAGPYTYDPAFPAPSLGGHSCCGAQSGPQGPYDQTPVEQRSDVLVYSSAPLPATPRSPGRRRYGCGRRRPRRHRLHRQADGGQTRRRGDQSKRWHPARPVQGLLSAPTPITPGVPTSTRSRSGQPVMSSPPGDRIRLEISSSDYPQFAPNPNTGEPFGMDSATRPRSRPSCTTGSTHPL